MEVNQWADFWRYEIGVNVIPADSIRKKTFIKWKDDPRGNWQIEPIPQNIHDEWKRTNAFKDGMAVICGKVFHNESKKHLYLCAIDADNRKGIEEMTSQGITEWAKKTLIEQHANPDKAHFYFYTTRPMPKKSSDAVNLELMEKMNSNEIPALEMKGDGTHGIMYCTPSPHKDGSNYDIIGIWEPMVLDSIGDVVNKICDNYSLGRGNNNKVPMKILMDDETRVIEGSNRHEAIMRYAESMLRKYPNMEKRIFYDVIEAKNKRMCVPPLDSDTLQVQIECAIKYISEQIEQERKLKDIARQVYGTDEFWSDVSEYKRAFNPKKNFINCLECKKIIEANPLDQNHYGHTVKIGL